MTRKSATRLCAFFMVLVYCIISLPLFNVAAKADDNIGGMNEYSDVFDASYYYQSNGDVAGSEYGADEGKLFEHFVAYGMREGRQGSEAFNPHIYKENYEDLRNAFGEDWTGYYRHYIEHGKAEGRNAVTRLAQGDSGQGNAGGIADIPNEYSDVFSASYYYTHNGDVAGSEYGADEGKLFEHFVTYGMQEGRQGSEAFNPHIYKENYEDLRNAFGEDWTGYYRHYIEHGKAEGRNAVTRLAQGDSGQGNAGGIADIPNEYSDVFSASYYYTHNGDVAGSEYGADERKLFEHFVTYGMQEGRQGSEVFNPRAYKENYGDLRNAFGDDWAKYYRHYIDYGKAEGRVSEHDHDYVVTVVAPTCTSQGYTLHKCSKCDAGEMTDYTSALEHNWDYDNPEACTEYGDGYYKLSCLNSGCVQRAIVTKEDLELKEHLSEIIDEIITDEMNDAMKVHAVNTWLCTRCRYDYDTCYGNTFNPYSFSAYGAIMDGLAVCQGYASAFKMFMDELGIENNFVTSASMNHAWNQVKIDGGWYWIDVTWNDNENLSTAANKNNYFLMTGKRAADEVGGVECNGSGVNWNNYNMLKKAYGKYFVYSKEDVKASYLRQKDNDVLYFMTDEKGAYYSSILSIVYACPKMYPEDKNIRCQPMNVGTGIWSEALVNSGEQKEKIKALFEAYFFN